jgi:signal transduction histidine kinase
VWLASCYPVRAAERVEAVGIFVIDFTERKRSERAREFLVDAATLLSSSLDYETTLVRLAHLIASRLGDFCIIDVGDGVAGQVHRQVAARDSERQPLIERVVAIAGPPSSARLAAPPSGRPRLISNLCPEDLALDSNRSDHRAAVAALQLVSGVAVPIRVRGRTLGLITILSTERQHRFDDRDLIFAEEVAYRAAFAVDNARLYSDAQLAIRTREEILAIVSHDLRNPLNAICLSASLLKQGPADREAVGKHAHLIERATDRMGRLIRDLLDFGSIQAGRFAVEPMPQPIEPILAEVVEAFEGLAQEKGIRLRRDPEPIGQWVSCDRERVVQLLANLVGNAVKFCRPGDEVTVRALPAGGEAHCTVSDTGPGISPEELPHVFERYFAGRVRAERGARSTGLGLHIAHAIVAAHGGQISAESELGEGTRIHFTLPLA